MCVRLFIPPVELLSRADRYQFFKNIFFIKNAESAEGPFNNDVQKYVDILNGPPSSGPIVSKLLYPLQRDVHIFIPSPPEKKKL